MCSVSNFNSKLLNNGTVQNFDRNIAILRKKKQAPCVSDGNFYKRYYQYHRSSPISTQRCNDVVLTS